jgi:hypothetical protein
LSGRVNLSHSDAEGIKHWFCTAFNRMNVKFLKRSINAVKNQTGMKS